MGKFETAEVKIQHRGGTIATTKYIWDCGLDGKWVWRQRCGLTSKSILDMWEEIFRQN